MNLLLSKEKKSERTFNRWGAENTLARSRRDGGNKGSKSQRI
jgi:hypothetical protein